MHGDLMDLQPDELLDGTDRPRPLRLCNLTAGTLARLYDLRLVGPDVQVDGVAPLSWLAPDRARCSLTYVIDAAFASQLNARHSVAVITTERVRAALPPNLPLLLTGGDAKEVFYTVIADGVEQGRFERLASHVSPTAHIGIGAVVSPHAWVSDGAVIGSNAVICSNTYVGPNVVVKANATIGGDGFETATVRGRRRIVPHAGGVWLDEGAEIGSSTCVDRGMFGEFTTVGRDTKIDNLVHFAHSARTGRACSIVACAEISGSCVLGNGVWVGPNVTINQQLLLGDHCYIGTGSVVTRDLPAHVLAYGSPAKVHAHVCACRAKLAFEAGRAACTRCGARYLMRGDNVVTRAG